MSFPRYPRYKHSGVEWLGEVPEHWLVLPAKRSFRRRKELNFGMKCENRLSLTLKGVVPRSLDDLEGLQASEFETYQIFHPNDLVFKLIDLQNIKTSRVGLVPEKGIMSPAYIRAEPDRSKVDPKYAFWFFTNLYNRCIFNELGGGVRQTISHEELLLLPFPRASMAEQTSIAAFLDRETAKIDELVAEQRRLMELLKEKRQAVISHAVTRGLNPDAPLKDSGVVWLREVPEHWRVGAIKYFVEAKSGSIKTGPFGSHLISSEMQSGAIKVYNQRSVIDEDFNSGENFITEEKFEELASFETFPGDLLITTRGTIGKAAILPKNAERGILHPCLLRLQPDNSQIDTGFLKTLIQDSDVMRNQLSYLSNATTIEVIYSYTIASVIVPVPPLEEQNAIMRFLTAELAKLDTLTAEAQRAIDLLQERRTALISAAVTGQIDVRETSGLIRDAEPLASPST